MKTVTVRSMRELDMLIAEHVMKWTNVHQAKAGTVELFVDPCMGQAPGCQWTTVIPLYTTDRTVQGAVINKLRTDGWFVSLKFKAVDDVFLNDDSSLMVTVGCACELYSRTRQPSKAVGIHAIEGIALGIAALQLQDIAVDLQLEELANLSS